MRGLNGKEIVSLESGLLGPAPPASAISDLLVSSVNKPRTVHKALLTPPLLLVGIAACGQEPTGWRVEALVFRDLCGGSRTQQPVSLPAPDATWTFDPFQRRMRSAEEVTVSAPITRW